MNAKPKTYSHGVPWEEEHGIVQGYRVNDTVHISGQFSHDTQGNFIDGDITAQTLRAFENLDRVLAGFGLSRTNIAYVELYLTNAQAHFETAVGLYRAYIGDHRPAGSCIGVTYLASPDQLVEVRAVAHTD